MPFKLMTAPNEKALFLVAGFGVAVATLAFFAIPAIPASGNAAGPSGGSSATSAPAGGATSAPARRATSGPARDAGRVSAAPPVQSASGDAVSPDALPLEVYADLLDKHYDGEWVDYAGMTRGESRAQLTQLVDAIANTDAAALETLRDADYIAWHGNVYNILTLETIVRDYPTESIRDLDDPWDTPFTVAGQSLTLNDVEHDIMRLQDGSEEERKAFVDPRLHFIVNCASIGCPVLPEEPLRGATLDEQMDRGVRVFMSDPTKYRVDGETFYISKLLDWYGDDFKLVYDGSKKEAIGAFFAKYEENPVKARLLASGDFDLEWMDYDWGLNEK